MTEKPTETSRAQLALAVNEKAEESSYRATAISEGEANGLYYSAAVLRQSLPLWEQANVFVDHAGPADWGRAGGRSIRDLAGVFYNAAWDEERGAIVGVLRLLKRMDWLCQVIDECLALRQAGHPAPHIGLSADLEVERKGSRVTAIRRVYSLDVVMNPARGGQIHAALGQHRERIKNMERESFPETTTSRVELSVEGEAPAEEGASGLHSLRREVMAALLEAKLAASHLPPPFREQIRDRFKGRDFSAEELDNELEKAKRLHAQLAEQLTIRHLGPTAYSDPLDRLQLAADRLFGNPIPDSASDIPRLSGIRELYLMCTGDYDMHGRFYADRVHLANLTTSSLTSIVKNALNKRLLASYEAGPQWWKPIVWEEDFTSLNEVTWITTGGFGNLPTVAEGDPYTELSNLTDVEETSSFVKKGAYIGITLEMIDRDDVAAMRAIPRKLGLAAARTIAADIAYVFTANSGVGPTLGQDSKALFHADHGNLGSTALSLAEWNNVVSAMFKQTEPASGKRLGIRPAFLLVPIELEATARQIVESPQLAYGGTTPTPNANVRYRSARVVVVPEFTDANDWAAVADPNDAPGICVGYRYGRAPELFVADDPLTGSMFTNDELRIKARFVYTVGIGEYRALYKENVS